MKTYIGTKLVRMAPMNRKQYNDLRGWAVPADEDPADDGYLVEYLDGGKPNVAGFEGYVSWSPKAQAEAAYRQTDGLSFGLAIEALKKGRRVARAGWNGKGMWLRLIHPYAPHPDNVALQSGNYPPPTYVNPYFKAANNNAEAEGTMLPWIGMKTADNMFVPWLASQTDMLADDWQII